MRRRTLLLAGAAALAGCAAPQPPQPTTSGAVSGPPPTPPSTPPPPPPPPPPHNPAFLAGPEPPLRPSGDPRFDAWRDEVIRVWGEEWRPYFHRLLAEVRPITVEAEPAPPEGQEAAFYVRRILTPDRIAEGRRRAALPWLQAIARRDGVPAEVLAAAWGAESDFGREQGRYDLLTYWATRAAAGDGLRMPDFGEVCRMVVAGEVPRQVMRCFADGSFGQLRAFPRQHAQWGADGDGDRRIDPWRSSADAIASASNAIRRGWAPGNWLVEIVTPQPGGDPREQRLWESVQRGGSVSPAFLRRADGRPWSPEDSGGGQVIQPFGPSGPTFLALRNFTPLRYLNGTYLGRFAGSETQSRGWGVAVGLLANAIRGDPPLSRPF